MAHFYSFANDNIALLPVLLGSLQFRGFSPPLHEPFNGSRESHGYAASSSKVMLNTISLSHF